MKKITILLLVMSCINPLFALASEYTLVSNPDGKIGSFILTVGGSVGFGNTKEYIHGYDTENYNLNSYSFLCRVDHPASRRLTFIVGVEYQRNRIATTGIYEGKTSIFQVETYLKFFTK